MLLLGCPTWTSVTECVGFETVTKAVVNPLVPLDSGTGGNLYSNQDGEAVNNQESWAVAHEPERASRRTRIGARSEPKLSSLYDFGRTDVTAPIQTSSTRQ